MDKIFVSYDPGDAEFVGRLRTDLAERGHDTWVDRDSVEAGAAKRTSITRAIRSCRAFVVVLSRRSVASTHVVKELSIADSHNRYIVPMLIEEAEIPPGMEYQLADLQWIDVERIGYEEGIDRVAAALDRAAHRQIPVVTKANDPPPMAGGGREARSDRRRRPETVVVKTATHKRPSESTSEPPTNRLAVVSLVSGLLGFTLLPGLAIPVALITGYIARNQILRSAGAEKGLTMARAGIVLGWLGLVVGILLMCYLTQAIDQLYY